MSLAPHVLLGSRDGQRMGDWKMVDTMIVDGLWDVYNQYHMGITAENVAKKYDITPRGAGRARAGQPAEGRGGAGRPASSRTRSSPFTIPQRKGDPVVFAADEFINTKTNAEALAGLRPAFDKAGTRDRGQCLGPQRRRRRGGRDDREEGAAARPEAAGAHRQAYATGGLDPAYHGHGPGAGVEARRCERAGWKPQDLDLLEINEAFAAQACAVNQRDGLGHQQGQRQRRRDRASVTRSAPRAAASW